MKNDYRQRIYQGYLSSSGHFYQRMTPQSVYDEISIFYRHNYRFWLPNDLSSRILDIGCGAGHFLYYLQKEGYTKFEGIDASREMLAQCEDMGIKAVNQADWLEYLRNYNGVYDAIVANDFLEHLTKEEVLAFLDLVLIALKPNGRLILKVPNAYTLFGGRDRYIDFTHELSFTPQSALQVLTITGYSPIQILPVQSPVRGPKSALLKLLWSVFFVPTIRAFSFMYDGERQPAIYTANLLAVGDKP